MIPRQFTRQRSPAITRRVLATVSSSTTTTTATKITTAAAAAGVLATSCVVFLYHNDLSQHPQNNAPTTMSKTFCSGKNEECLSGNVHPSLQLSWNPSATRQPTDHFFNNDTIASIVHASIKNHDKEQHSSSNHSPFGSIMTAADGNFEFKPILEATVRAMRLVKTVLCIVMDYKLESYKEPLGRVLAAWGMGMMVGDDGHGLFWVQQKHDELICLEKQVHEKSLALQQAQRRYAEKRTKRVESTQHYHQESMEEKRENVYLAAQELAKAELNLSTFLQDRNKCNDNDLTTVHERAAKRILDLCRTNGGTYIKVGQHLANLDHLLPEPYIRTLQSLFGDAPVTKYEHVREVIREELGHYPEELFQEFQEKPIASASLAQVHVATNFQGQKLAVKVQHRGLRETSRGDLLALEYVVRLVDGLFEEFKWGWVCDEIAPNLPKELDFVNEGKNAQAAAHHFKRTGLNCVVPKVHWDQTTSRVLVMDFEEGFSCTNMEMMEVTKVNKRDLAVLISSVFQSQVFQSGFVHCDPHAENVYWRMRNGRPQLVLFDHGLYKQIDDNFRLTYAQLWKSLLLADVEGIKTSCSNLGVHEMYPLLAAMLTSRPFDEVMERNRTQSFTANKKATMMDPASDTAMIRSYAQQYLKEIIQMLDRVPRQMLLLFKMNDCLRHIDHSLGSPANTIVVAGKYAAQTVYDHEQTKAKSIGRTIRNWFTHSLLISRIRLFELTSKK